MTTSPIDVRFVALLGTGHALPSQVVASTDLDRQLDRCIGTVERVSGVRRRHFATREETAATLAAEAARRALDAARLSLADIDCLVAASGTQDQGMPCNAALVHRELGLSASAIPAFDINASCLSFVTALDTMAWPIVAGRYRRVLVVSADIASCGLDWSTLESSAIFGDGAAAAVLGPSIEGRSRLLAAELNTYSEGANLCRIPAGGSRYHPARIDQPFDGLAQFRMDGKGVFRLAAAHLPTFVERLLARAGVGRDQIDWVVPHQASQLAMKHIAKKIGFRRDKIVDIFAEHGNQVAASLPTALDVAIRDGRIQRGQRLLLLGTGAGLSLGGMVLEY
ncbi:beta-ketoacyl-ACP synthase III [Cupriavidus sp. BIS7]|uniref:beta-ketoacyl-ACP synthase III n=1 Tax=Cupriavidus sp. BIS7 TaxID=1217718 RepID=UPI00037CA880|nr:beta-ketoacyl-ACP synthase III [Cupriavidus sp. BIS7]